MYGFCDDGDDIDLFCDAQTIAAKDFILKSIGYAVQNLSIEETVVLYNFLHKEFKWRENRLMADIRDMENK